MDFAGRPSRSRLSHRRPLITGLSAGTIALGVDYLAHAVVNVPLAPEQAGYVLLKVLPLPAFADLLKTLGTLARPLLLMGATIVIIVAYGAAAAVLGRLWPRWTIAAMTALVALVATVVAVIAISPGDSALGIIVEVVLLAGIVPLVDAVLTQLMSPIGASEDRRVLLRNLFYGAVGIALVGVGYANVRRFVTALATREGTLADSEVTSVSDFYVVSKNLGGDPVVEPSSWRLNLPNRSLTYEELLKLPSDQLELTLECISNEVGGTLISNGIWKGPRVSDILALTTVPSDAVWMLTEGADLAAGAVPIRGIAFAGARRISGVDVSWDGGSAWQAAELQPEFSAYAWRFWELRPTLSTGQYRIRVRARDGEGTLQPSRSAPTLPNGADGYHTITITVA